MGQDEMEHGLRNLDQRVERVEPFLPTPATKNDLQVTRAALRKTKVEIHTAINEAEQQRMRTQALQQQSGPHASSSSPAVTSRNPVGPSTIANEPT